MAIFRSMVRFALLTVLVLASAPVLGSGVAGIAGRAWPRRRSKLRVRP